MTTSQTIGSPAKLLFSKYHGLGNDFILIDYLPRHYRNHVQTQAVVLSNNDAMKLCDRHFGGLV